MTKKSAQDEEEADGWEDVDVEDAESGGDEASSSGDETEGKKEDAKTESSF